MLLELFNSLSLHCRSKRIHTALLAIYHMPRVHSSNLHSQNTIFHVFMYVVLLLLLSIAALYSVCLWCIVSIYFTAIRYVWKNSICSLFLFYAMHAQYTHSLPSHVYML